MAGSLHLSIFLSESCFSASSSYHTSRQRKRLPTRRRSVLRSSYLRVRAVADIIQPGSFGGSGSSLTGRSNAPAEAPSAKGKAKEEDEAPKMKEWGSGQRLGTKPTYGAGGARAPAPPRRSSAKEKERSPTPDFGVDDDDVIDIDSD